MDLGMWFISPSLPIYLQQVSWLYFSLDSGEGRELTFTKPLPWSTHPTIEYSFDASFLSPLPGTFQYPVR